MRATKAQIATLVSLKKRAAFLHAQKKGERWVSKSLILQAVPNETGETRFGITVTKKGVSKSAVIRNRVRRRLRSAACDILPAYAKTGTDYVLIARAEMAEKIYEDITNDLRWCLKRLGCLKS